MTELNHMTHDCHSTYKDLIIIDVIINGMYKSYGK